MSAEKRRRVSPMAEAELRIWEVGRERMRKELEEELQRQAKQQGAISPPDRQSAEGNQTSLDSDSDDLR